MTTSSGTLIDLETKFWQSMVDQDTAATLELLHDPCMSVNAHGAMKLDHAGYQKRAEQGSMVVRSFALSDVAVLFPNETTAILTSRVRQTLDVRGGGNSTTQDVYDTSTWINSNMRWQCVLHTQSLMEATPAEH